MIVLLLFMAIIVWALPIVKRWSIAVAFTPVLIALGLAAVVGLAIAYGPSTAAAAHETIVGFLLSRPTLVGIAIGAAVASVVWWVAMWLRRRHS